MSSSGPREPHSGRRGPLPDEQASDLLRAAHAAATLAYSPYSGLRVGAALLGAGGAVYTGCNVENASYGLTVCAERAAAVKAVSAGELEFVAIAVASGSPHGVMPCGACRQFLSEFSPRMRVIVEGRAGPRRDEPLERLLPDAFGPPDIGVGR